MVLMLQSWLVVTAALLTLLLLVVGVQAAVRRVRRPAQVRQDCPPVLRLVHSAA